MPTLSDLVFRTPTEKCACAGHLNNSIARGTSHRGSGRFLVVKVGVTGGGLQVVGTVRGPLHISIVSEKLGQAPSSAQHRGLGSVDTDRRREDVLPTHRFDLSIGLLSK
jgi:hypothetical protein